MSHFTVMVIGDEPEDQLAKYSENIEFDEYLVGAVSEDEKNDFIDYYKDKYFGNDDKSFDELYELYGEEWNRNKWRINPEDGEWSKYSTYNPDSKWDWYSLGGRWSGRVLKIKDGATGVKGRAGVFDNKTGIDAAYKKDIENINEIQTFAVVKDGVWYERGEMGWWAIVSNEKDEDEWKNKIQKLLESLPDDTLISIYDCHI